MPRVKGGIVTRKRRKKVMKLAKGYRGAKHMQFTAASTQLFVSYKYAFRDRRRRKSEFRKLWIARINAAARQNDISYSKLMHGLKLAGVDMNRKMLADIAYNDSKTFAQLAETAKKALN
ncbi:MAG: 50S ribosomal protein L20 [Lactobacillus sp.]|nr:50S ribosomal protein L20 [Lactobacillus sp.]